MLFSFAAACRPAAHHPRPPPTCSSLTHTPPPTHSRKTLIYLILTLNHIYPDYDFTLLRAQHFRREPGGGGARESIETHLLEVAKVGGWVTHNGSLL
jgi:hypothetical protein